MKKIVKGKLYNTDTAKKVAEWSADIAKNDLRFYSETLYQKRTGEFFLYGEGGPDSKYAKPYDGDWVSGEKIIPLSLENAKETVSKNLDTEEYEKIFGDVSEGSLLGDLHVQIDSNLLIQLKQKASDEGKPLRELVEDVLKQYLNQD